MNKTRLDFRNWNRREHYEFFSKMDEPFYCITADVDCTNAYAYSKGNGLSFFKYYHFIASQVVNRIKAFRLRIEDGEVFEYHRINLSTTILRPDNTFGFALIKYHDNFESFALEFNEEMRAVIDSEGLRLDATGNHPNQIHYSTIPWINFTSLTHARNLKVPDCVPKISFGKYKRDSDRLLMPVSVHVHHGLMDGYHVGQFFEQFEAALNVG